MKKKVKFFFFVFFVVSYLLSVKNIANASSLYEDVKIAIQEIEYSYFMRGKNIQYNSMKNAIFSPEEATEQNLNHMVCSRLNRNVYNELGLTIPDSTTALLSYGKNHIGQPEVILYAGSESANQFTAKMYDPSKENNIRTLNSTNFLKEDIIPNLEIGDVLTYAGGHTFMVYDLIIDGNGNKDVLIIESANREYVVSKILSEKIQYTYANNKSFNFGGNTHFLYYSNYKTNNSYVQNNVLHDQNFIQGCLNIRTLSNYSPWVNISTSDRCSEYSILRFIREENGKVIFNRCTKDDTSGCHYECKEIQQLSNKNQDRIKFSRIYIEKTVDAHADDVVREGENLTYKIIVKNNSDSPYNEDLTISENISEFVTYNEGSFKVNGRTVSPTITRNEGEVSTISYNLGQLAEKEEKIITYTVRVKGGTRNETIISTGNVANIPSAVVKNKIGHVLTEDEMDEIQVQYNNLLGQFSGKEFINKIYQNGLGIDLGLTSFNITELINNTDPVSNTANTISLNNSNKFYDTVLNQYWNAMARIDKSDSNNHTDMTLYDLKYWESYGKDNRRQDTIYSENFETGDILIYTNYDDSTTDENGEYAYLYIEGQGFVGVNSNRNKFDASYYDNGEISLYKTSANSQEVTDLDFLNYQTLFGKDYYVILRPSLGIRNLNYELDGGHNSSENPTKFLRGDDFELKVPFKEGNTFQGWYTESIFQNQITNINQLNNVTDNTVLYAKWESNKYTVTWKDDNGNTIDTTEVAYGEAPTHANPSKPATAQYTYTFAGWSPEVGAVTGEATYTATYTNTINKYTITWKDDNGNTIDTTEVEYGTVPTHAEPSKAATAQDTYTFAGWTPEVEVVTKDATYTATYTNEVNKYTITWKDDEGNTIDTTEVAYGETPTHADPSKTATAQYTYEFSGWSPSISPVTGEVTYTATYTSTVNKYTITWKDDEGNTINTTEVAYGTVPTHEEPSKAATAQYTYTFAGWGPEVTSVTGEATYTASYTSEVNKYTITWKDDEGNTIDTTEVAYGTVPTHEEPSKAATAQYTYTFAEWRPAITNVTGDATYQATYTEQINQYKVTFLNYDGATLYETMIDYGSTAEYVGDTPEKESDEKFNYIFTGWDDITKLQNIKQNVTVMAQYRSELRNRKLNISERLDITREEGKGYIANTIPQTSINSFLDQIDTDGTAEIYHAETKLEEKQYNTCMIGTGDEIKVTWEDGHVEEFTIIVIGDLNGDGQMTDGDLMRLARYIAKIDTNLTNNALKATDVKKDNKYASDSDLVKMARILVHLDHFH